MSRVFPRIDSTGTLSPAIVAFALAVLTASSASAQPDPFGPFPGRGFRGTRPPRPTVQPGEEARVEEEIEGAVRVAILNLDRSALGVLVEARLRDKKMVNWWPRHATGKLLSEAQLHPGLDLQAAPNANADRPPLPDALILVRMQIAGDEKHAEVVVCEPALGLRLGARRIALIGDPAKDADALAAAATTGLKKLGEKMRHLWAIPPFRSGDLVTDRHDLRFSLARDAEQALLAQKGAFAVELDYAHVIAAARAIAGIDDGIRRPVPRFVRGEYRHDGDSLTVSVTIQEQETPGQLRQLAAASVEEVTQALQAALGEVGKAVSDSPADETGTAEKNLIATASRDSQREGNWRAALALAESRLLLDPAERQWRAHAIGHAAALVRYQVEEARRFEPPPQPGTPPGAVPAVVPAGIPGFPGRKLPDAYRQAVLETLETYRRAMRHFQRLVASAPPAAARGNQPALPGPGNDFMYAQLSFSPILEQAPELAALVRGFRRQRQELLLAYIELAAASGEPGDMYIFSELTPEERKDLVLRMVVDFRLYPRAEMRNQAYIGAAFNYHGGEEKAEQFLAQLAVLSDPTVQKAVAQHRQRLAARPTGTPQSAAAPAVTRPEPDKPDPNAQIVFKPLSLPWKSVLEAGPDASAACELFLPLGKAGDLFCYRGQILLSRKKGEYKLIWEGPTNLMFKHMTSAGYGPSLACFDGKYAWVPLVDPGKPARLLVIDPATEKVAEVTGKEGLPADPAPTSHPQLAATALAPGKVFLAGSFGRAYLAVATFDSEKGSAVKVIHEARDLPVAGERDQHLSATLAFDPVWLFTLTGKSDDGKPMQRVLVGRYANSTSAVPFPLVVDPESGKVEVLTTPLAHSSEVRPVASEGGIVWTFPWQMNAAGGHEIWRLSLPELKPQSVGKLPLAARSQYGSVGIEEGRVHLLTQQWHTAGSWGESLSPLAGKVPGQDHERRLPLKSELHGWLLVNPQQSRLHAVEFRE